jgi:hypothetical protein
VDTLLKDALFVDLLFQCFTSCFKHKAARTCAECKKQGDEE